MIVLDRRAVVAGTAALSTFVVLDRGFAGSSEGGPFKLPPLPYPENALEPTIDAKTMGLHHGKHHAAYVSKLNEAVKDHGELAKMKLEDILANLDTVPEDVRTAVRNNGGGHANHTMFWTVMGKGGGAPEGDLAEAIESDLGGLEKFKADFNTAGGKVFGSGWVFVTADGKGKLALTTRPNQDTPLMDKQPVLFGNDVWEHAYYLTYNNRRPDYLKAWWDVVNWKSVGERYAAAKAGKLPI